MLPRFDVRIRRFASAFASAAAKRLGLQGAREEEKLRGIAKGNHAARAVKSMKDHEDARPPVIGKPSDRHAAS